MDKKKRTGNEYKGKSRNMEKYCDKLLNRKETTELIKKGNKEIGAVEVEVEELTIEDGKKAIRNL